MCPPFGGHIFLCRTESWCRPPTLAGILGGAPQAGRYNGARLAMSGAAGLNRG